MEKTNIRRLDLWFSAFLMLVSAYVLVSSFGIFVNPFGREFVKVSGESIKDNILNWFLSPALMPFLLSIILMVCAIFLFRHARSEGATFGFGQWGNLAQVVKGREFRALVLVSALLLLYVFVLMPLCRKHLNLFPRFQGFPFMVSTFIYLSSMMIVFNDRKIGKILLSLLVSAIAAAAIAFGFGMLAMIPLP